MSDLNELRLYDTFSKEKARFEPLTENEVKLYVCGVTVYDRCHLGHARCYVAFDNIVRHFQHIGYQVKYVRNITDVDDKIIKRANEAGIGIEELTESNTKLMHQDFAALNLLPPTVEPKATTHITQMIEIIQGLLDKDIAYIADNGDVLFSIKAYETYGQLSGKSIDDLVAGSRVAVEQAKQHPGDFVLWKQVKPEEPSWEAPFGKGRPGWHIECSAMAKTHLGETFDIHGGGSDLVFPHHENERAQSEALHGKCYSRHWMHVGFVNVNDEKMSKSLGNFATIADLLKNYPGEVLRFYLTQIHYRSPINFTLDGLEESWTALKRLYTALRGAPLNETINQANPFYSKFMHSMNDDFNTSQAVAVLFEITSELNRAQMRDDSEMVGELSTLLKYLGNQLGLLEADPNAFLTSTTVDVEKIELLIEARNEARRLKEFSRADAIRDELDALGITLEDSSSGTLWRTK